MENPNTQRFDQWLETYAGNLISFILQYSHY